MAGSKQKTRKSSSSGQTRRPAKSPGPLGPAANPTRGRHEQAGVDQNLDEREMARKNAKPRSARQTLRGPDNRKAPRTSGR